MAPSHAKPLPVGERTGPRLLRNGFVRMLVQFRPLDNRRPLIEQPGQRAQEPCLALSPLAEQDNVMAGEQGALKLGQDGSAKTVHPRPWIAASSKRGKQVVADLVAQILTDVAGCTQFSYGEDFGAVAHTYTVALEPALNIGPDDFQALRWKLMTEATPPAPSARPTTLLFLVRHGETPTTGTVLPGRAPGLRLSVQGRVQAERVAERLTGLPVDAIYSSPLERALETAEPTAACTGMAVNLHTGLIECDFGEWTGAALAELSDLPQWQSVQHAPSSFRFPGGESFQQMQARIVGALEELCTAHAGGVVVCFSHADPIKAAIAHAVGTHLDLFQRVVVNPGSVSVISYTDGQPPAVLTVNSTLEPLSVLRTP